MGNLEEDELTPNPFYDENATRVAGAVLQDEVDHNLLVAYMTISDYLELFYDEDINLKQDISPEYIRDVVLRDFNKIVNSLRRYKGKDRRGITEARENMDAILHLLYDLPTESDPLYLERQAKALLACRRHLELAHGQLGHLEGYANSVSNTPSKGNALQI